MGMVSLENMMIIIIIAKVLKGVTLKNQNIVVVQVEKIKKFAILISVQAIATTILSLL
jgi:hypothetical protein